MLRFEPLPIFEARNFLYKYCNGLMAAREGFPMLDDKKKGGDAERYFSAISQMENLLTGSLTVSDGELGMLFSPLRHSSPPTYLCACDMLIRRFRQMQERDPGAFFAKLREEKQWIPSNIAVRAFDEKQEAYSNICRDDVLTMIADSDMSDDEKLTAFDLLMKPDAYIDLFERAMRPVVDTFSKNSALLEPLAAEYKRSFGSLTPEKILEDAAGVDVSTVRSIDVYPSLMEYYHSTVSFADFRQEHIDIYLGALVKFDRSAGDAPLEDMGNELLRLLGVVGNPNRFKILCRIAKKPAYGRELAAALDLTPGTVSQHLSILSGSGFISVTADGTRLNYRAKIERFEDMKKLIDTVFTGREE